MRHFYQTSLSFGIVQYATRDVLGPLCLGVFLYRRFDLQSSSILLANLPTISNQFTVIFFYMNFAFTNEVKESVGVTLKTPLPLPATPLYATDIFFSLRWWKLNRKLAQPFPEGFRFLVKLAKFYSIVIKNMLVMQSEFRRFNNKTNLHTNKI